MKIPVDFTAGLAVLMCLLCASPAVRASSGELELPWSDLGSMVAGHRVKLVLPDTEVIQGLVVAVREDALVLNINKTSNRQKYPKGQNVIQRVSVSTIQVETSRSSGRIIGLAVGSLGGLTLGGDLAAHAAGSEAKALSTFFGVATACTLAGYYLGRAHDRPLTVIRIVPSY